MHRSAIRLAAVMALLGMTSGAATAHHSGAMFDAGQTVSLSGTVRQFQWVNPHCFIQLVTRDAQGREQEWSLEMSAPVHLMRLGWTRSSLAPGERITVQLHPLRNGDRGGNVVSVTDAEGNQLGATR